MKLNMIFLFFVFAYANTCFAQDEKGFIQLKNEGNAALREQNYKDALELYEAAFAIWPEDESPDGATFFNTAECARRLNIHDKALEYYKQAKDLNFRPDRSAYFMAVALRGLEREEEMEQMLLFAIDTYKTSTIMAQIKKMLVTYYLKQGAEPYNRAAQILASAANANPSQFDEITQRANQSFAEAKPWFEKALEIDPENENAVAALREINNKLK